MPGIHRYAVLLERFHLFLFGVPAGEGTRSFIRQLHWSMLGGILASGMLFGVSVWAGRLLGTGEYGKYSFALAIAQMVALLITWSFEVAIVRALAFTRGDSDSQTYIISSAVFFLVATALFVNGVSFLLPFPIMRGVLMTFATVLAIKMLLDGIIRGLGLFAHQAMGKVLEACIVLASFALMVRSGFFHSYSHYLLATLAGAAILVPWYAFRIRSDISIHRISPSAFQVLWTYGSRAIIWLVLSMVVGFAAKVVIRYELGYEFLGQFTVYYMLSVASFGFLGGLVANVLFPLAVQEEHNDIMWSRVNRSAALVWFPLWLFAAVATNAAIVLYGPSYYLAWWFGAGMAAVGVVQFLCGMYWLLIISGGVEGVRYASLHCAIAGVLFILSLLASISFYPMAGILLSYCIGSAYMVWATGRWRRVRARAESAV